MASKLSAPACASFSARRACPGSIPAASCCHAALLGSGLQSHVGMDAKREALFLAAEAVLPAPPLPAGRVDFQVQAAAVEELHGALACGLARRIAVSVSGMWGQLLFVVSLLPPKLPHKWGQLSSEGTGTRRT